MPAELKVEELRKQFATGRPAVDGVGFDVGKGEIVVLLGPSGCGKTTTLRCSATSWSCRSRKARAAPRSLPCPRRSRRRPPPGGRWRTAFEAPRPSVQRACSGRNEAGFLRLTG